MAIQVKHSKVSTIPDADDTSLVRPSDWNADHVLTGTIPVANGGTGADNATDARTNLSAAKSGANSDITSMTGVTGGISSPDYIQFDTTYATTLTAGQLGWDGNNTLGLGMSGGNIVQEIGLQTFIYGKASSAITKGQLIRKTGATGSSGVITFAPTTANMTNSTDIIGIAAENIALNAFGYIMSTGNLRGFNTTGSSSGETWADGDILYYNPSGNGLMTKVKPSAPNTKTEVAIVTNAGSGGSGSVVVEIIHGSQLGGTDSNVQITSPTTGQTLVYNQSTDIWSNSNAPTIIGGSINNTPIGATTPSTGVFTDLTDSGLTSGRVTYAGTGGNLRDASNFTYDGTNLQAGAIQNTPIGSVTPAAGTFTTITGQTEVLRGTGQNLFLQSNTFNTSWTVIQSSITGSQSDPFGGSTAWLWTADGTNNPHNLVQNITFVSGLTYTFSVFAKRNTNNFFQLSFGASVGTQFVNFDLNAGTVGTTSASTTGTITAIGNGWYRCSMTATATAAATTGCNMYITTSASAARGEANTLTTNILIYGAQVEIGSVVNTYIPTTTTAVYGTPTLSFSGVSTLGLESNGALFLQPAGTGAIQAQATTSTAAGGNARGANAVDWQTSRDTAARVASGSQSFIGGGSNNTASGSNATISGGQNNTATSPWAIVGGGRFNNATSNESVVSGGVLNTAGGGVPVRSAIVGGASNTAAGFYNIIGGGFTNSGTSSAAVTTQSGTMNGTTAVTLSGSNANIRVGQYITGTSIATDTYVAAISGTSLTLSQAASGSSTSTLSFFTPHGVVVGGGNNQATGAYSFIGGGGDAGTAGNRNVASGDWSVVTGGQTNTASGFGSSVAGGRSSTASGTDSHAIGFSNTASQAGAISVSYQSTANGIVSSVFGGRSGNTRSIAGNMVLSSCNAPITSATGITQSALLVLARQTTDATPTVLASDSAAAGTTNQVILPNNSAYYFTGEVVSGVTGGGNSKGWEISGLIKRGANAAATTLVGSTVTSLYADAGAATWTIALAADTTNGGLRVTFTGQAGTTIRTVCQIRTTEMTF